MFIQILLHLMSQSSLALTVYPYKFRKNIKNLLAKGDALKNHFQKVLDFRIFFTVELFACYRIFYAKIRLSSFFY